MPPFGANVGAVSLPSVGWGTAFLDYDNDTLLDLIAVNGHVYPQMDAARLGASAGYRQAALLFHNRGNGTFEDATALYAPVTTEPHVGRGLAIGDLDNDGRLDVVVNDLDGQARVLHNELPGTGHWVEVKLHGGAPNTDAIGAVISVDAGGRRMVRVVQSGTSYLSQDDMRQHFGLGPAAGIDRIEVRWPDGTRTSQEHVTADRLLELQQR